jgi:hypothetical protein
MATKKKPAPPQLASSRVARALDAVEFAKAVQNPDFDAAGYPETCQRLSNNPNRIRSPEWTDFIVKVLRQHSSDPLTCQHLIEHSEDIANPAFTSIIVQILRQHVARYP